MGYFRAISHFQSEDAIVHERPKFESPANDVDLRPGHLALILWFPQESQSNIYNWYLIVLIFQNPLAIRRKDRIFHWTWQATVYGKRDGVLTGLAITHRDSRNLFHTTKGCKTGAVHGIGMCPRSEMYKPEQATCQICFDIKPQSKFCVWEECFLSPSG